MATAPKSTRAPSKERIPRRSPPEFEETESGVYSGIVESGLFKVALDDSNQYGPHAMIFLLFAVAGATALAILAVKMVWPS
ncbi:MAG: hypothetical protein VYA39_01120 [Candidatus Thermoplasmatota archaeon]|nr:hypothetical protein [Candidatus Thermoplasmatota archaeon]MEC7708309.1 hypothetical protein [Candidatus Thermoplasmatota archaeon]|tara:strand:+ start:11907 stop:12149 length:243 start_codon:yes stop_codon:yes gene_type:complete